MYESVAGLPLRGPPAGLEGALDFLLLLPLLVLYLLYISEPPRTLSIADAVFC